MTLNYFAFMKPILAELSGASGRDSIRGLTDSASNVLDLSEAARKERSAWDGMLATEGLVRKAVIDLERAGLVRRDGDAVALTAAGRAAAPAFPAAVDAEGLAERFAPYADFRREFLSRRGA